MRKRKNTCLYNVKRFPEKLLTLLNSEKSNSVLEWSDNNYDIIIKDIEKLPGVLYENNVFNTVNFDSIKKQFNLYNFQFIDNYKIIHPNFRKFISKNELINLKRLKKKRYKKYKRSIFQDNIKKNILQIKKNNKLILKIRGKPIDYCLELLNDELLDNELSELLDNELLEILNINEVNENDDIFESDKKIIMIIEAYDKYVKEKEFDDCLNCEISTEEFNNILNNI